VTYAIPVALADVRKAIENFRQCTWKWLGVVDNISRLLARTVGKGVDIFGHG